MKRLVSRVPSEWNGRRGPILKLIPGAVVLLCVSYMASVCALAGGENPETYAKPSMPLAPLNFVRQGPSLSLHGAHRERKNNEKGEAVTFL